MRLFESQGEIRMRKFLRITGLVIAGLLVLSAVIVGYSAYRYSREMAVEPTRGVNESGYVRIGGIEQWIQIRGEDRRNPVILWLNGGPGFSTMPATRLVRSWEHAFTVVMWDQRGEGKTFQRTGSTLTASMTVDRMTQDGIEVAEYVRARLQKDKIIVLGHSWGSVLGVRMVKQRPDLFSVYVGTGQVTSMPADAVASYPLLRARAHDLGNRVAEEQLASIGPPPFDRTEKNFTWIIWANALDPGEAKPATTAALPWEALKSLYEQRYLRAGLMYSQQTMMDVVFRLDLSTLGYQFDIPVVIIQGSEDLVTVTALAQDYFDKITAPHKEFVVLRGSGHLCLLNEPDTFLTALLRHVRPLVAPGSAPTATEANSAATK